MDEHVETAVVLLDLRHCRDQRSGVNDVAFDARVPPRERAAVI